MSTAVSSQWLNTAGVLYLFFDRGVPKFFVSTGDIELVSMRESVPVRRLPGGWRDYRTLHAWLHNCLGTGCEQRRNEKVRRNGQDSEFSALVRLGDRDGGCFDTPFIDIDSALLRGHEIVGIYESKQDGERMDKAQAKVLRRCEQIGFTLRLNEAAQRAYNAVLSDSTSAAVTNGSRSTAPTRRGPYDCCACGKLVPPHERPSPRDALLFAIFCDNCTRATQSVGGSARH